MQLTIFLFDRSLRELFMKSSYRRELLLGLAGGSSLLALRAAATGLPAAFLLAPLREAHADTNVTTNPAKLQFLVMAISDAGEPINNNAPGGYAMPDMNHSTKPWMQAASLQLGEGGAKPVQAAQIWNELPQWALNRTAFIQHSTGAGQHGSIGSVMQLMGRTKDAEMIPTMFARHLAGPLATLQKEPIAAGAGDILTAKGIRVPNAGPLAWKQLVGQYDAVPNDLQKVRDRTMDKMYAVLKSRGTRAQLRYLDQLAKSGSDAKKLGGDVANILAGIKDDGNDGQLQVAAAIMKMNVSPVVAIRLNFGGDNHADPNLDGEARDHQDAIKALARFFSTLKSNGLEDKVTFASFGVFGRNFKISAPDLHGRDHWSAHATTILIGKNVRPGLYGGSTPGRLQRNRHRFRHGRRRCQWRRY
jgi:Protein of unknown function (DUF1501)